MPTERLLTTGQLADALGIPARSLARWAQDGKLTPTMITPGGQYRWRLDDVQAELRAMRRRSD